MYQESSDLTCSVCAQSCQLGLQGLNVCHSLGEAIHSPLQLLTPGLQGIPFMPQCFFRIIIGAASRAAHNSPSEPSGLNIFCSILPAVFRYWRHSQDMYHTLPPPPACILLATHPVHALHNLVHHQLPLHWHRCCHQSCTQHPV